MTAVVIAAFGIPYRGVLGGSNNPEQQPAAEFRGVGCVFQGCVIPGSHQQPGGLLSPPVG